MDVPLAELIVDLIVKAQAHGLFQVCSGETGSIVQTVELAFVVEDRSNFEDNPHHLEV